MKILLITETWDVHNGPYESLFPNLKNIFVGMGHQFAAVDNKKNYLKLGGRTAWEVPHWMGRLRWLKLNDLIVNMRVRQVALRYQPDLICIFKGENIYSKTITWLRQHTPALIFNWDHDNPFWPSNTSMDLLRSIPLYDAFFVLSKNLIPALESIGCQRTVFLPMFFNEERFLSQQTSMLVSDYSSEVAFIGIGSPERAEMLNHLLDFDLAIWGNWSYLAATDPLRAKIRGEYLDGAGYAAALHQTKIAVNVMNMQCRGASNTRTFEAPGMGALLLTEYSREQAEDLYVEDREIVCFRSSDELKEKTRYYLTHEIESRRIADAGRERTLREHTLRHRLETIIQEYERLTTRRYSSAGIRNDR